MTTTYLSEESRARAEAALAFHASDARKAYSSQRIPKSSDDLCVALRAGVEKLRTSGSELIAMLAAGK